jgi:hypothetical protein
MHERGCPAVQAVILVHPGQAAVHAEEEALQSTAGADYFEEGRALQVGQIYVSEFNLNREGGAIQVPHTPVVHFTTPVPNAEGGFGGVQADVDRSVQAMEEGVEQTEAGARVAGAAGEALKGILGAVESVSAQIQGFSASSDSLKDAGVSMVSLIGEILSELRGVSETTGSIAAAAEENAAGTQQVSAAAEEMNAQVEEVSSASSILGTLEDDLRNRVSSFKLLSTRDAAPERLAQPPEDLAA